MKTNLQDAATERAVLSGLCQYGLDCLLEIDFLDSTYFYNELNQSLFECINSIIMSGDKVELSAILSRATEFGLSTVLNTPEEIGFLRSLFNFPVHIENLPSYAGKLAKLKIGRDVKKTLKQCENKVDKLTGEESINDILSLVETPILDLTSKVYHTSENKPIIIGSELEDYIQHLMDNPTDMIGIPTGFTEYDLAIGGGLRRKCIDLIGARAKVGKSLFADAVAINAALKMNIPVLMLDTEMGKEDHYNRMLANLSNVPIDVVQTGKFKDNDLFYHKIKEAAEQIKSMPYHYISVAGQSFENILAIMRKWIYQHVGFEDNGRTKDCLIIYDYLKLMSAENINQSMQEYQALGFLITQLHNFCVKYDVPCLSFVQLNRDGITKESTDVISGSDRLVWLCTSFSLFKVKSDEEQADDIDSGLNYSFNRKLVPLVSRHGGCLEDGDYINIAMQGKYARLTEGPTRNNLKTNNKTKQDGFEITDTTVTDISDI